MLIDWKPHSLTGLLDAVGIEGLSDEPHPSEASPDFTWHGGGNHGLIVRPQITPRVWRLQVLDPLGKLVRQIAPGEDGILAIGTLNPEHLVRLIINDEEIIAWRYVPRGRQTGFRLHVLEDVKWQNRSLAQEVASLLDPQKRTTARRIRGLIRAVTLEKLGAQRSGKPGRRQWLEQAASELADGSFDSHFPRYWSQMHHLYRACREHKSWLWAARTLTPPCGSAYNDEHRVENS